MAYSMYLFNRGEGLLKLHKIYSNKVRWVPSMAYAMYLFTRGEGLLKTTQDLFKQAEVSFKYSLCHVPVY